MIYLYTIISIIILGFLIASAIKVRSFFERISLSFLLGSAIYTFTIFIVSWLLSVDVNLQLIIILDSLVMFIFALAIVFAKEFRKYILRGIKQSSKKLSRPLYYIPAVIIGLLFTATAIFNLSTPIKDWDSLTLYDFRSRIISKDQSVTSPAINHSYYLGYPMYTSLGHSIAYSTDFNNPKLWYSLIYLSLALVFYSVLRRDAKRFLALIGAIAIMISPAIQNHATVAYTNLAFACFFGLGVLYHILWLRNSNVSDLAVATFLVTFSAWIRFSEPFWMIVVLMTVVGAAVKKKPTALLSVLPIYLMRKVWLYFKNDVIILKNINPETDPGISLINQISQMSLTDVLTLIISVSKYYYSALILKFPLLIFTAIIGFISIKDKRILIWNIIYLVLFFGMIYAGTGYFALRVEYWSLIPDSLTRMSFFLIPILYYTIFIALSQILDGNSSVSRQKSSS